MIPIAQILLKHKFPLDTATYLLTSKTISRGSKRIFSKNPQIANSQAIGTLFSLIGFCIEANEGHMGEMLTKYSHLPNSGLRRYSAVRIATVFAFVEKGNPLNIKCFLQNTILPTP